MKLRIHGDSIRLRLSRSEVAGFAESGRVEETVRFGHGAALRYVLESTKNARSTRARFDVDTIRITVPEDAARHWTATDEVSIVAEQALEGRHQLSIVVEKDFQCIHKTGEQDEDAFPNPLAARG